LRDPVPEGWGQLRGISGKVRKLLCVVTVWWRGKISQPALDVVQRLGWLSISLRHPELPGRHFRQVSVGGRLADGVTL
jgi:hypothetical protein